MIIYNDGLDGPNEAHRWKLRQSNRTMAKEGRTKPIDWMVFLLLSPADMADDKVANGANKNFTR